MQFVDVRNLVNGLPISLSWPYMLWSGTPDRPIGDGGTFTASRKLARTAVEGYDLLAVTGIDTQVQTTWRSDDGICFAGGSIAESRLSVASRVWAGVNCRGSAPPRDGSAQHAAPLLGCARASTTARTLRV